MPDNKSVHILNTSSNLMGFCLVVLTSLKISNYSAISMIDEFTGAATILLIASSIFSFLSIRSKNEKYAAKYENIAENIFIISLISVFAITFMIAFSIIF
ncbi:MAG: hypothetical protein M3R50_00300 [Bacteroidota bacterium]|nr:hypothetical protein [Bacteroidota bacterium]